MHVAHEQYFSIQLHSTMSYPKHFKLLESYFRANKSCKTHSWSYFREFLSQKDSQHNLDEYNVYCYEVRSSQQREFAVYE